MSLGRSQFNRILNIIDQRRLKNQQLHQERKDQLNKLIPELASIDRDISSTSMSLTRDIIANPDRREEIAETLKRSVKSLAAQKQQLLLDAGYPQNYLEPIYTCSDCKDTGFINNEKCHCLKKEIINFAYAQSNLDHILKSENFEHFSLDVYSDQVDSNIGKSPRDIAARNHKVCYNFTADFGKTFDNLILYGQAGLGKTFLCNCIAKELLDHSKSVIYLTAFNLFKLLENYRFHNDESGISYETIQEIYQCDLLIIDDLGTELNNAFTTSELFSLINARLLDEKPIVISTNLSPNGLANQYSDRIVSRIFGNYKVLNFIGSDIRLQQL